MLEARTKTPPLEVKEGDGAFRASSREMEDFAEALARGFEFFGKLKEEGYV